MPKGYIGSGGQGSVKACKEQARLNDITARSCCEIRRVGDAQSAHTLGPSDGPLLVRPPDLTALNIGQDLSKSQLFKPVIEEPGACVSEGDREPLRERSGDWKRRDLLCRMLTISRAATRGPLRS